MPALHGATLALAEGPDPDRADPDAYRPCLVDSGAELHSRDRRAARAGDADVGASAPARQNAGSPPSSPRLQRTGRVARRRKSVLRRGEVRGAHVEPETNELGAPGVAREALTTAVRPGVVQPSVCRPRLIQSARYGRSTRLTDEAEVRRLVSACEEEPRIARRGRHTAERSSCRPPVRSTSRARARAAGRACSGSSRPRRRRHV